MLSRIRSHKNGVMWGNTWWRHQMETFSALLAHCAGNSSVTRKRPMTRNFEVFFDLRLNKRLSKQSWGWWLETPSRPLWRHCNDSVPITGDFAQTRKEEGITAPHHWPFEGNPPVTGKLISEWVSHEESVSTTWCHHGIDIQYVLHHKDAHVELSHWSS